VTQFRCVDIFSNHFVTVFHRMWGEKNENRSIFGEDMAYFYFLAHPVQMIIYIMHQLIHTYIVNDDLCQQ